MRQSVSWAFPRIWCCASFQIFDGVETSRLLEEILCHRGMRTCCTGRACSVRVGSRKEGPWLGRGPGSGRSEERRVGKECRSRWSADHEKKKRSDTTNRNARGETNRREHN